MIPKKIHYCWFGGNPKPKLARKCIKSWKKYCPDYKVIEWNESNYNIEEAPLYVRQAYQEKKWAFVTDYIRLQVVYEHGGVYLDTDVELLKTLSPLLRYNAFFGFEDGKLINTGCGFGAEKGTDILKELMTDYEDIPFILEDGSYDTTPCPVRNTECFLKCGLVQDNSFQLLDGDVYILPSDYLCPKNWKTGEINISNNTVSIHHFDASWYSSAMYKKYKRKLLKEKMKHIPSSIGHRLFGKERYEKIRKVIKK